MTDPSGETLGYGGAFPEQVANPVEFPLSAILGSTSISLTWAAQPNTIYYRVWCGLTPDSMRIVADRVTTTGYAITGLTSGLPYFVQVSAVKEVESSQYSAVTEYLLILPVTATPVISPAGGVHVGVQTITITDATAGATIYYTTDGSIPTTSSPVYSAPFALSNSATVAAIALAPNYAVSNIASAAYTILLTTFWDFVNSLGPLQNVTYADGPPGSVSIFQKDQDYSINGTNTTQANGANNVSTTRRQAQLFPGIGASTTLTSGGGTNSTGVSWPFGTSDVTLLTASNAVIGSGGWIIAVGGNLNSFPGSYGISVDGSGFPKATIWDAIGTPYTCTAASTVSAGSHIYGLRRSGVELSLWVDGVKVASTALPAGMSVETSTYLYTDYNQGGTFSNSLIFPEGLTDAQMQEIYTLAKNGNWLPTGFDPFQTRPNITVSNSQRTVVRNGIYGDSAWRSVMGNTFRNTGKRYAEFAYQNVAGTTNPFFGVSNEVDSSTLQTFIGNASGQFQVAIQCNASGTATYSGGTPTTVGSTTGSLLRVAADLDAGKVWLGFLKNDGVTQVWAGGGNPATNTTPTYTYTPGSPQAFLQLAASMYNAPSGGTLNATTGTLLVPVAGFTAWDS